jgi:hypothetical protein
MLSNNTNLLPRSLEFVRIRFLNPLSNMALIASKTAIKPGHIQGLESEVVTSNNSAEVSSFLSFGNGKSCARKAQALFR